MEKINISKKITFTVRKGGKKPTDHKLGKEPKNKTASKRNIKNAIECFKYGKFLFFSHSLILNNTKS